MQKSSKSIALALSILFLLSMMPFVSAAETDQRQAAAEKLHALGLLAGVGNNADGSVNFDVNGSLTRVQSVVQIVRFLGAEKTATTAANANPFTDLAAWAVPYVSYAYANGITSGRSATTFDPDTAMNDAGFLTLLLRVLGYEDKNDGSGDFVWSNPYTLAQTAGLIDTATPDTSFTRGDAFVICYRALTATVKSGDKLCDRLVKSGTVEAELMKNTLNAVPEASPTVEIQNPIRSEATGDPCIRYDNETGYYYALYTVSGANRIVLFRAKTIDELGTAGGKVVYTAGENAEIKHKIYAPELAKIDGKWYIYASGATSMEDKGKASSPSIRLFCLEATSDDPYGDYVFKGLLNPYIFAIDAHAFTYQEENYIAFSRIASGNRVTIARLENPWTLDPKRVTIIASATLPFETMSGKVNEGPFTFTSPNGRLFMLYSANNFSSDYYCLGLLEFTGDDILAKSSWTKTDHAVFIGTKDLLSPGHCSVFMSPDGTEYWLAYHYRDGNRKLSVQKFTFDENGFPIFGEPISPGVSFPAPSGE